MDAILLRSLPVKDPESLVLLKWHADRPEMHGISIHHSNYNEPGAGFFSGVFSYPAFELFRKQDTIFSSVFAYQSVSGIRANVSVKGQAGLANAEYISGDYFGGLGVPPAAGRMIGPDDDRAGAPAVAVVSFGMSESRFGGPANAVGQPVLVDTIPFTVIGVAPPEFFGTDPGSAPEIFLPIHTNLLLEAKASLTPAPRYLDPNFDWLEIMARLRPGVSVAQAQAALAPVFRQFAEATADPRRQQRPTLAIQPGAGGIEGLRREYSKPLYLLLTLVGLILAIACSNIANLLLARAASRRRELAVRLSMGAGRLRLIRQLLTESMLLAGMGGVMGIAFALWGIRFLTLLLANGRDNFTMHAGLNWRVLGVTAGLSMLSGILFGLAPALQSTRIELAHALKETTQTHSRRQGLNRLLLVSQISIALLMMVAAGLFARTLSNLESINLGFNRENVLTFQLNARQAGHQDPKFSRFTRTFYINSMPYRGCGRRAFRTFR
jgi:predicted permease